MRWAELCGWGGGKGPAVFTTRPSVYQAWRLSHTFIDCFAMLVRTAISVSLSAIVDGGAVALPLQAKLQSPKHFRF